MSLLASIRKKFSKKYGDHWFSVTFANYTFFRNFLHCDIFQICILYWWVHYHIHKWLTRRFFQHKRREVYADFLTTFNVAQQMWHISLKRLLVYSFSPPLLMLWFFWKKQKKHNKRAAAATSLMENKVNLCIYVVYWKCI